MDRRCCLSEIVEWYGTLQYPGSNRPDSGGHRSQRRRRHRWPPEVQPSTRHTVVPCLGPALSNMYLVTRFPKVSLFLLCLFIALCRSVPLSLTQSHTHTSFDPTFKFACHSGIWLSTLSEYFRVNDQILNVDGHTLFNESPDKVFIHNLLSLVRVCMHACMYVAGGVGCAFS